MEFKAFCRAYCAQWMLSVTGTLASLILTIAGLFADTATQKRIFFALAIVAAFLAVVRIWTVEYRARLAAIRLICDGRPRLSLETSKHTGAANFWEGASFVFFLLNMGERSARNITFEPITSLSGDWELILDDVATLLPKLRPPLGFRVKSEGHYMPPSGALHYLKYFFGDGDLNRPTIATFDVRATFYDLNDLKQSEQWVMECEMPLMAITIKSVIKPSAE